MRMSWIVPVAVLAAGAVATFTDWFFMGVLFHDRYAVFAQTWRPRDRPSESAPILYSCAFGFVTAAAVMALCAVAGAHGIARAIEIAVLAWLAGSFVQVATTHIWIRIDLRVSVAHALGYLARFLLAGLAAGIALPMA